MPIFEMIFLGSGAAFTVGDENYHSNVLLIDKRSGQSLLIDCGSDIRNSLDAIDLAFKDIEEVYISHVHADHTGGLEWLGFTRKFTPSLERPRLHLAAEVIPYLWENTLKGGMATLDAEKATLDSYFNVNSIGQEMQFQWAGIQFNLVKNIHVIDNGHILPCFGLFFEIAGRSILYTADTRMNLKDLEPFYQKADLIFHDCETAPIQSTVHSHYDELRLLPSDYKNKMWLYHFNAGQKPDAITEGFKGFVQKGQRFEF